MIYKLDLILISLGTVLSLSVRLPVGFQWLSIFRNGRVLQVSLSLSKRIVLSGTSN